MSTGKVVLGTVAGLAIGGILGILYAPEKGSVTRQQILDSGNDYADELKSRYNDLADTIVGKLQSGKDFVKEITENGKAELDELKKDVNQTASNYNNK